MPSWETERQPCRGGTTCGTFSPEGKTPFVCLCFKLHTFTYQCLRNPVLGMLFLIKYYHCVCVVVVLEEDKIRSPDFKRDRGQQHWPAQNGLLPCSGVGGSSLKPVFPVLLFLRTCSFQSPHGLFSSSWAPCTPNPSRPQTQLNRIPQSETGDLRGKRTQTSMSQFGL